MLEANQQEQHLGFLVVLLSCNKCLSWHAAQKKHQFPVQICHINGTAKEVHFATCTRNINKLYDLLKSILFLYSCDLGASWDNDIQVLPFTFCLVLLCGVIQINYFFHCYNSSYKVYVLPLPFFPPTAVKLSTYVKTDFICSALCASKILTEKNLKTKLNPWVWLQISIDWSTV